MNPNKDPIYLEVAGKCGVEPFAVYEAITSMLRVVVNEMDAGRTTPVRLPFLGIFTCKPGRLEKLGLTTNNNGIIKRESTTKQELLGVLPASEDNGAL